MEFTDIKRKYMVSTAAKFQFHLIARLDDTCRFEECDLKPHPQFPFALLAKMCWSKNVREERDAPDQIVLGAMDFRYCILLALGVYLETWHPPMPILVLRSHFCLALLTTLNGPRTMSTMS
jgi:hypothetical protein